MFFRLNFQFSPPLLLVGMTQLLLPISLFCRVELVPAILSSVGLSLAEDF
jgi:hypothetical protein